VLLNLLRDPEGREQCGDCGNWVGHAPDCVFRNIPNPPTVEYY
jgi:hypothetical protein